VTPGQQHDAPVLKDILSSVPAACPVKAAVMDKAYDSDEIRATLKERNIEAVIPTKSNRVKQIPHDKKLYQRRNCGERLVGKLNPFASVPPRYDNLARTFLGGIPLPPASARPR